MRNFIETLSALFGGIISSVMLILAAVNTEETTAFQAWAHNNAGLFVMLILAVGMLAAAVLNATLLALTALVTRGPKAINWVRPRQCRTMATWFSSQWRFPGAGGPQEGLRLMGLEIALKGTCR